jgi:transposase
MQSGASRQWMKWGVSTHYTGTLVHDFWKAYLEYGCDHTLCNAHHLRNLTFCKEVPGCNRAKDFRQYLLDLYEKAKQADKAGEQGLTPGQRKYWNRKFTSLMQKCRTLYPPPKKMKGQRGVEAKTKSHNLLQRFEKYKSEVHAFSKNFTIPFSNHLAEQAIRMMKVKQKISGFFRSEQGAKDFAAIRIYTATMQKHAVSIIDAIHEAIKGTPRLVWA